MPASVFTQREGLAGAPAALSPSARMRQFGVAPESLSDEPLLGRYRILELRDVGGFGSVLVCWDVRLQRRVAVKCLPLDVGASAVTLDEALAEARASSFLAHPNIVTVHDFEVADDWAYLVMEYVDGVTLAELQARVEGGVLVFDEAAYLLQCLASALDFAHRNGVLHLDIKPQNVMIDRSGQVKLGDFGMASLASAAGWGGARGGTVGYMAPEQLEGELVDERSDVFSLGTVLYEAITGDAPFRAATAEASLKLIEKGATPIDELEGELEPPIAAAIMAALEPEASRRPSSVAALANLLLSGGRTRQLGAADSLAATAGAAAGNGHALPQPVLGDPARGLASIRSLMDQTADEGDAPSEDALGSLDPPGRRVPYLAGALSRAMGAVALFVLLIVLAPAFGVSTPSLLSWDQSWPYLCIAAAAALLSAAWTPLAAALGIAACVWAVGMDGITSPSLAIILGTLAAGGAWWILFGRKAKLASCAFLAPATLISPFAAPGLAGYALRPLAALATGFAAPLFAEVVIAAMQSAFAAEATGSALVALLSSPGTWICLAGCAAGAWLCSLVNLAAVRRRASSWMAFEMGGGTLAATQASAWEGYDDPSAPAPRPAPSGGRLIAGLGELLATASSLAAQTIARALENGGIYGPPDAASTAVALVFCALMLLVVALFGPSADLQAPRVAKEARVAGARSREGAGS